MPMHYDRQAICDYLIAQGCRAERLIEIFEQIDSTNRYLLSQTEVDRRICLAERQENGRGRRGRQWVSGDATSILLSMGWECDRFGQSGLSLISGMAVVHALKAFGLHHVQLKWPNDLLVEGRKLGGVLVECQGSKCVIGVGLNLDLPEEVGNQIDQQWTDLHRLGLVVERNKLVASLIANHDRLVEKCRQNGFAGFVAQWNALHSYHRQQVLVEMPGKRFTGRVSGVDQDGALLIEHGGQVTRVVSSDVSIRRLG